MSQGCLKIRVKLGETIHIGNSKVIIDHISQSGWSAQVLVLADKSIKVWREPSKDGQEEAANAQRNTRF
jgi:hypothetical protein